MCARSYVFECPYLCLCQGECVCVYLCYKIYSWSGDTCGVRGWGVSLLLQERWARMKVLPKEARLTFSAEVVFLQIEV